MPTITHNFVSAKANSSDATIVNPSDWNYKHTLVNNVELDSADFAFDAITTVERVLTAGITNTITLAPVPKGINGTDTKHYLYIQGGTGTAEAVLITGGTAVSGATSGTITFVPANSHTGAWIVQSASDGISEAAFYLGAGTSTPRSALGTVRIPAGTHTIYGAIPVMLGCTFRGAGRYNTYLVPPTNSSIIFDTNLPVHSASELTIIRDEISFFDFTIDGTAFNAVNTIYGIKSTLTSTVPLWGCVGAIIQRVNFINCTNGIVMHRAQGISILDCSAFGFTKIKFTTNTPTTDNPFNSYEILLDNFRYYNYGPNANLVFANAFGNVNIIEAVHVEVFTITNSVFRMAGGTLGAAPCCIAIGGASERILLNNVLVVNHVVGLDLYTVVNNAANFAPAYITVDGLAADQPWGPSIRTTIGTSLAVWQGVRNLTIVNSEFTNPRIEAIATAISINLQDYTKNVLIANNKFTNMLPGATAQSAITIGVSNDNIEIAANNQFVSDSSSYTGGISAAIFVQPTATKVRLPRIINTVFVDTAITDSGNTVASASTIALPFFRESIYITGTTTITAITSPAALSKGYRFTLFFGASISVTKGGTLHMSANFGPTTTDGSLTLEWNGAAFLEISRCVN